MKAFCIDITFHTAVCTCFVQSFLSGKELICLVHVSDLNLIKLIHGTKTVVALKQYNANDLSIPTIQHAVEAHLRHYNCE